MTLSEYYQWLKKDWAKVGLILAVFLLIFLFVFVRDDDFVVFLLLLQTPLYMLHEAEEYIFPGGFGKYFNTKIFKLETEDAPLDENFIFFVNVILIWIALPLFGLLSTIDYRFGLWIPYFSFFAGVAHIALAIKAKKLYSPGLIVSHILSRSRNQILLSPIRTIPRIITGTHTLGIIPLSIQIRVGMGYVTNGEIVIAKSPQVQRMLQNG
ncbi:MAG: HXXEE domain-containing protein [Anaerolineae bacterium]|jgi:hypothetical protein|nr:HXXEE domain-containing protein [Anaerolineae bacterium]MBT7070314.1 HXXEE domain-containing protein [Anaerolineae bacterium]MBT7324210.1 HXXEE domain-containing protein [Anaerolineae bacterium]